MKAFQCLIAALLFMAAMPAGLAADPSPPPIRDPDLQAMLVNIGELPNKLTLEYGNVSKTSVGAISYVELSYAENSGLSKAKVANGSGEFVELTPESAGKTVEAAEITGQGNDLKLDIDYATKAAGAYPIVLVTYEITSRRVSPRTRPSSSRPS